MKNTNTKPNLNTLASVLAKMDLPSLVMYCKFLNDEFAEKYLITTILADSISDGITELENSNTDVISEIEMKKIIYEKLKYIDNDMYIKYNNALKEYNALFVLSRMY